MTNWASLSHAYGAATDTPELLAKLRTDEWQDAISDLYGSILHQGTIYTATIPAIPELVTIAQDPTAPARAWAAHLVADFADSIRAGWTRNPNYLPKKLNLDHFDKAARTALADAVIALTPSLDDTDTDIRHATALLLERAETVPPQSVAALHQRLATEHDTNIISVLVAAIQAHDALTPAEASTLADAPSPVRFAQSVTALRSGSFTDDQVAVAADLWDAHVNDYEATGATDDLIATVVSENKLAVLPLLDHLSTKQGLALRDAILGYRLLATWFRAGLAPALDALLELAAGVTTRPEWDRPLPDNPRNHCPRNLLVMTLAELKSGVPADQRTTYCDAIWALVTTCPRPAYPTKTSSKSEPRRCDIRSDAVPPLIELGDPRWIDLYAAVQRDAETPVLSATIQAMSSSIMAVERALTSRPCPPGHVPPLVELIGRELAKDDLSWIDDLAWFDIIAQLPSDATLPLASVTVSLLADAPLTVLGHDNKMYTTSLLQRSAPLLCAWRATDAVPRLRQLAQADWPHTTWAQLALQVLTGQSDVDTEVDQNGLPQYAESDFLALWRQSPTPGLVNTCVAIVGDTADGSFPGRNNQLLAARIAATAGRLPEIWPTVLAIVAAAREPMRDAVNTAVELAGDDHGRRTELTTLLTQMAAAKPKRSYDGLHTEVAVIAWDGLIRLGAPLTNDAAKAALTLLETGDAPRERLDIMPMTLDLLKQATLADPSMEKTIKKKLTALLNQETRSDPRMDAISRDIRFTDHIRQAIDAINH